MPKIRFSMDEEELRIIEHEAAARGLQRAAFCKTCVFSYINKSASKGVFSVLDDIRHQKFQNSSETPTIVGPRGKLKVCQ